MDAPNVIIIVLDSMRYEIMQILETDAALLDKLSKLDRLKMVNVKSAAQMLGYTEEHLRRLNLYPMKDNVLPRVQMGNRRVFYLVEDLIRFIEKRRVLRGY